MSIKSLLKSLLGTVFANTVLCPTKSKVAYTVPASGGTLVAPADGYCQFSGNNDYGAIEGAFMEISNDTRNISSGSGYVGGWVRTCIPVKKGDAITVFYKAKIQQAFWSVNNVIGGGAKNLYYQLLNGGALCLRLSSWLMPSLPHGGVVISRFPNQRGSRKTLQLREGMRIESGSSPRQTTDFSWLKRAFRALILPGGAGITLTYRQPVGAVPTVTTPASAIRWLKATRLRLSQAVQTTHLLRFICVSTRTLAPSLSFGGAL